MRGFAPRCEWELDPRQVLVGRRLAVGGFAEVFLGKYEGTVVAIKRLLTNDAATIERFVGEVRMLARLRHPNLILFMGYCTLPELCIVSEFMSKGSLYGVLHSPEARKQRAAAARKQEQQHSRGHPAEEQNAEDAEENAAAGNAAAAAAALAAAPSQEFLSLELAGTAAEQQQRRLEALEPKLQRLVAVAVARGMAYLHTRTPPILHLDLKSPNILVDERWRVKITDFGLSRARQRTFVSSSAQGGTPEWMAPEVLRCESVAEPADVYSYGVVLWELITGRAPWENYNPMQVVAMVGFRELQLPLPTSASEPFLLELCKRCLARDPAARPSFPQISALLDQHYGPPSWAAHATPLMPPTPRPALLAPAAAGAGAEAGSLRQAPAVIALPAPPAAAAAQQQQQDAEQPCRPVIQRLLLVLLLLLF
ncbi:hypothetical protein OEZ85_007265 [Tetradesmus obliquus]|uniref:Protein kinase domain-containing protein n=1 Tax=Tetradesmus obliquus TaxID=3088 RepID=A0ABY8TZL7_TETOB|nr:hypothetical protein OEZ85_007265 [Tetradesmus obliquus]